MLDGHAGEIGGGGRDEVREVGDGDGRGVDGVSGAEDDSRKCEWADLGPQFGDGENEASTGVEGLLGELRGGVHGVNGGGDGSEGYDAEKADGEVDGVGGEDEDDVTLLDAEAGKASGYLGYGGLELVEGHSVAGFSVNEGDEIRYGLVAEKEKEEEDERSGSCSIRDGAPGEEGGAEGESEALVS